MRDNDTILLESLYTSLVLEDAQSQINQAANILKKANFEKTKADKGGKIPPEEFESFKVENQKRAEEIINGLKSIIDSAEKPADNPSFGNGYEFLPALAKIFIEMGGSLEGIRTDYHDYCRISTPEGIKARRKKIINTLSPSDFGSTVHTLKSEETNLKKSEVGEEEIKKTSEGDFSSDSNTVYEDENVIVLKGTVEDLHESVKNCRKYGQGLKYDLCISGNDAYRWYMDYRFNYGLTTYFVYFKNPNKNAKEGFIIIDYVNREIADENGKIPGIAYQYNIIVPNTDITLTSEKPIIQKFPELEPLFTNNNNKKEIIIRDIPLIGDELEIKEKVYKADSIFDKNIITNPRLIQAFIIINDGKIKKYGDGIKAEDLIKVKEAMPDKSDEIIANILEMGVQLDEESYNELKPQQQKRWAVVRLRKIEQAFGLNAQENPEEPQEN
jgi:hypothetical protein